MHADAGSYDKLARYAAEHGCAVSWSSEVSPDGAGADVEVVVSRGDRTLASASCAVWPAERIEIGKDMAAALMLPAGGA